MDKLLTLLLISLFLVQVDSSSIMPFLDRQNDEMTNVVNLFKNNQSKQNASTVNIDTATNWEIKTLEKGTNIPGGLILTNIMANVPNNAKNNIQDQDDLPIGSYYWDVSSFSAKSVDKMYDPGIALPTSRNYLPYVKEDNQIVLNYLNSKTVIQNIPDGSYQFSYLINNDIVIFPINTFTASTINSANYKYGEGWNENYFLYNKSSNEVVKKTVNLPKFVFLNKGYLYFSEISFSPDGKYILYRSKESDDSNDGYRLLDLKNHDVIWTVPVSDKLNSQLEPFFFSPTWKHDAKSLTYIYASEVNNKNQNFVNVSLDGQITQFTFLDRIFQPGYILFSDYQWSPDDHYLAFVIQLPGQPVERRFVIWDDLKKELISPGIICHSKNNIECFFTFDWSPTGEYISLQMKNIDFSLPTMDPSNKVDNFILDFSKEIIYKLPGNQEMQKILNLSKEINQFSANNWLNWEIP